MYPTYYICVHVCVYLCVCFGVNKSWPEAAAVVVFSQTYYFQKYSCLYSLTGATHTCMQTRTHTHTCTDVPQACFVDSDHTWIVFLLQWKSVLVSAVFIASDCGQNMPQQLFLKFLGKKNALIRNTQNYIWQEIIFVK